MNYVDIHCHLDFKDYDPDREEVLRRMKENKIGAITIGTDLETSKKAVEIANENDEIWATIGIHPEILLEKSEGAELPSLNLIEGLADGLEKLVTYPKVVAIGECGLEYFVMSKEETEKIQKKLFEEQIQFAIKHNKPLMLHIRPGKKSLDAYFEALDILESYKKEAGEKLRGDVHFFAGNVEIAKKFLDLGFAMSFTGVITFTRDYNEVIKYIPPDSIMSETDAPFVAPVPYRGKRNEPAYVIEVVKKMAEIRNEDLNVLNNSIIENCRRIFGWKNV